MSEIKVNKITPRAACGTTQLGDSGDTFTIPSGATITNLGTASGFGATGAVNWDVSSIKTTDFTAVSGNGYFVDTATTGAVIVTLPAAPSVGDVVGVSDYANNFATANCTLNRNSLNIGGVAVNATLKTNGVAVTLVYVDVTKGWIVTDSGNQTDAPTALYVAATGGCITTCGNYKVHTFKSPGTFTVSCAGNPGGSSEVEYIVVAGGAGGSGGGGGAGGFRFAAPSLAPLSYPAKPLAAPAALAVSASPGAYPICVGAAGTAGSPLGTAPGGSGGTSSFHTITSAGGGGGSKNASPLNGTAGGSGGGAGADGNGATGGAGNTPPVSPPQGNPGGSAPSNCHQAGGGGGGALAVGGNGTRNASPGAGGGIGGDGGVGGGFPNAFGTSGQNCGSVYYFAGGGAGGSNINVACGSPAGRGSGGLGGGGQGGQTNGQVGCNATINTGGGGGGSEYDAASGGSGGSGIVIIRYKYQ